MPKRICLVTRSLYPYPISKHTQNMRTFEGWHKFFDDIVIITQGEGKNIKIDSYKKYIYAVLLPYFKNKYINLLLFTILSIIQIIKLNKKYQFDIIQTSDAGGSIAAYISSIFLRKKFLFEVQGEIFDYPSVVGGRVHSGLVQKVSKIIVKKAHHIRVVSPFLRDYLIEMGVDSNKIFLVYPRCDNKIFDKGLISKNCPNIFKKNKNNIIFVGNLLTAKGVKTLLLAFDIVSKKREDVSLIFVGDGKEKANLINLSKSLFLSNHVFFTGRLPYKDIPLYMNCSDILVLPSIEEGIGRVLIEAMSLKLNVIGSKAGGIPLIIDDEINGLLFETDNFESLAQKIFTLLDDNRFAEEIRNNAYEKYLSKFHYDISMNDFITMYHKIFE